MFEHIRDTVRTIPRGKVASYGEVARAAGFPGSARQVVWALRGGVGLPWHRVIGAGGRILLPGEAGFEQRTRLAAEGVRFQGDRIPLDEFGFRFPAVKRRRVRRAPRSRSIPKRPGDRRPRR
jgi:methylated-DNA-protein-cysteine methyltransferase-like protein